MWSPFRCLKFDTICKVDQNKGPKQHTRVFFTKKQLSGQHGGFCGPPALEPPCPQATWGNGVGNPSPGHWHGRKRHGSNISSLTMVPPSIERDSLPCPGRDSTGSDLESHLDEAEFKMSRDAFDHCLLTMDLHVVTGSQTRRKLENFSAKMSRDAKMCH